MISLCPFCQSKFVVSKQQLEAADGVIRCGVCMQLFMAEENEWIAATKRKRQKQHDKTVFSPPTKSAPKATLLVKNKRNQAADDSDRILEDGRVEPVFARVALSANLPLVPEFELDIDNSPLKRSAKKHGLVSLLRFVIALCLTTLLSAALYLQWQQPATKQIPDNPYIQQAYHLICSYIQCKKPPQSSDYQSQQLLVRSNPLVEHGLIVETIIVNRTQHSLPYPLLALEFRTLANQITAQRVFSPKQYLHGELQGQPQLAPLSPAHITLQIVDPGNEAVNYTLRLLAPSNAHPQETN